MMYMLKIMFHIVSHGFHVYVKLVLIGNIQIHFDRNVISLEISKINRQKCFASSFLNKNAKIKCVTLFYFCFLFCIQKRAEIKLLHIHKKITKTMKIKMIFYIKRKHLVVYNHIIQNIWSFFKPVFVSVFFFKPLT